MATIATLKATFVPDDLRATLYNIFRVPLNLIVVIINVHDGPDLHSRRPMRATGHVRPATCPHMRPPSLFVASDGCRWSPSPPNSHSLRAPS